MRKFSLRSFAKDAAVYSVMGWLSRTLGILLIPVYTRIFSPADYGILDLVTTVTAFLTTILQLGLNSAVTRFFNTTEIEEVRQDYFATVFWTKIFSYGSVLALFALLATPLSTYVLRAPGYEYLIYWALASVLSNGLWIYLIQLYRWRFQSVTYSALSLVQLLISTLLTIYWVVFTSSGIIGIYWARVITDSVLVVGLIVANRRFIFTTRRLLNVTYLREMLVFGLPLIPTTVAYYIMQYMDRYFIQFFHGEAQLGIYAIAYRVSSVLALLAAGFQINWTPFVWSVYSLPDGSHMFRLVFKGIGLILALLALGAGIFAKEGLTILTTSAYVNAATVVHVIAFSIVVYYLTSYFCFGIEVSKKTYYRTWAGGIAASVNLVLNWLLIPRFGIAGAAWATFCSYAIHGWYVMAVSERLFPVNYNTKEFAGIIAIFLLSTTLVTQLLDTSVWLSDVIGSSLAVMLAIKALIFLIVGLGVPLSLKFITQDDLRLLYTKFREFLSQRVAR